MADTLDARTEADIPRVLGDYLNRLAAQLNQADYSDLFRTEVVPLLVREHEEYFNKEAGPAGPWAPLAPRTVKKKGFDTILVEYNNMRSSLLFEGPDHIEDITDRTLAWGTSDPKAEIHQNGVLSKKIPARPFVGMTEDMVDTVSDLVADAATAILGKP